ncbi:MAG TPA: hypothetical protein EYG03_19345 [Planctomycetes bacterium]|nr:hypothetical protein [Fuerstiella sp.]HIK94105.1 hypothetical protein [Planctomycetota bacterium]
MITPQEIRTKAVNLHPQFLTAWLTGEEFFPRLIPSSTKLSGDLTADGDAIRRLRSGSKEVRGFGYTVQWATRRMKLAGGGRNDVPERIVIETQDDLLALVNRKAEFDAIVTTIDCIRSTLPQLESWIHSHVKSLPAVAEHIEDLLRVTQWFQSNPCPGCYAREVPLDVHGKFIQQNKGILKEWFDVKDVLPPEAIRADEEEFFRRYGLRDWEPMITLRCLDQRTQAKFHLPCAEASIPLHYFNEVDLTNVRIFIVENLTNVRTFPEVQDAIVIFGMGNAAGNLRALKCLMNKEVVYWGDLDVYGLRILSQYRRIVGPARSVFMDLATLQKYGGLPPKHKYKLMDLPPLLQPDEQAAFIECNEKQLQLEQERIPQCDVRLAIDEGNY